MAADQKKLTRLRARLICLDETGFLMAPVLRRTWAPRGRPPLLPLRTRAHEKVSAIGALVVSPRRRRVTLYLALHTKTNVRGPQVLHFLRHLNQHHRGVVILLWDRAKIHAHQQVRAWLAQRPQWRVEWLPPYAPELNPVDHAWAYFKYGRLANFAPDSLPAIQHEVTTEAHHVNRRPDVLKGFFRHARLLFL